MPTVPLYPSVAAVKQGDKNPAPPNPLPELIQTPSGLAILEIQGTLNIPEAVDDAETAPGPGSQGDAPSEFQTPIGRLVFPDYDPKKDPADHDWMKRVHLYVGRHQRLTGEVKKLPRPLALIQRQDVDEEERGGIAGATQSERQVPAAAPVPAGEHEEEEGLEIVELVMYKLLFSSRPEPVTDVRSS